MTDSFFNKDELEKIPPGKARKEIIKKKLKDMEKKLEEEADELEKESSEELEKQQIFLEHLLREREGNERDEEIKLEHVAETQEENEEEERFINYSVTSSIDNEYVSNREEDNVYTPDQVKNPLGEGIEEGGLYENNKDYS